MTTSVPRQLNLTNADQDEIERTVLYLFTRSAIGEDDYRAVLAKREFDGESGFATHFSGFATKLQEGCYAKVAGFFDERKVGFVLWVEDGKIATLDGFLEEEETGDWPVHVSDGRIFLSSIWSGSDWPINHAEDADDAVLEPLALRRGDYE